jgi:hypothetical protein
MLFHRLLLTLPFILVGNAQTPECATSNTCFGEAPSKIDYNRGMSVISVACSELVGNYIPQEQRLTCAFGNPTMKFDFAVRNLDTVTRFVSTNDCVTGMTYILKKYCGYKGGRQTQNKIMFLSVPL